MTTQEIANRLVELCRTGKYEEAVRELYSPDIVSVEPEGVPNRIVSGLEGIAEKGKAFEAKIEKFNSSVITDPIVADNIFSCAMLMNVNMKGVPVPVDMNEICVYTVADGKIVKEEFFYTPPAQ
ncbi:MAG: SnoaL-like domain-containing protein [Saprospiraceae bacterium]